MTRNFTFLLYFACLVLAIAYPVRQQMESVVTYPAATTSNQSTIQQSNNAVISESGDDPYIDDIIEMPVSPETQGYAPTSIKDFNAADPTEGLSLVSLPAANNMGSAVLTFNLNLPKGRQGVEPDLRIQYNSEAGASWLGNGWNLLTPAISIETRWGVPRYDANWETEMYLMNGEQLSPVNNRDQFVARTANKQFYPRVENDFKKIIRHGNSPSNYWWEVTDKTGTVNSYGGRNNAVVNNAVLKDELGNIAYWALVETRDANDNFVRYEYDTVMDAGIAGSTVPGVQLYLGEVVYTGNGTTDGAYKIEFTRDRELANEPRRKDVTIDARLGFKQVTADLLRKITVKYNDATIRSYNLAYSETAFYKSMLQSISELDNNDVEFYKQELEYYDDARTATLQYKPADTGAQWHVPYDTIRGNITMTVPEFNDHASVINSSTASSESYGTVITVGTISGGVWSKKMSVGGGFSYVKDKQSAKTTLIDINGDGLPDKIYKNKRDNRMYYRRNLGGGARSFGEPRELIGINEFNYSTSEGWAGGAQILPFTGFLGYNYLGTTTTTSVYFTDFNGDGLMDVADNGRVLFNHLNAQGDPEFVLSSDLTPNQILSGTVDPVFLQKDTALQSKQERQFPLQDIIRFWQAPVAGTVTITAPVQLVEIPNSTGEVNEKKDGVRVTIQRGNAATFLYENMISATDFSVHPINLANVTVARGQRIYFRMQSVYNGEEDVVNWDPIIQYTTAVTAQSDRHHKTSNYYRASEDFLLHSTSSIGMAKNGDVSIDGTFKKQITSDSVFLAIIRNRSSVLSTLYQRGFSGNEVFDGDVTMPGSLAVLKDDELRFKLTSKSYIDRTAMQWRPHYAYTAFTAPDSTPVISNSGRPTIEGFPIPDNSNFNHWMIIEPPVNVTQQDTVKFWPQVTGGNNGTLWFTVKGTDTVYARRQVVINGGTMSTNMDTISLIRKVGEPLFLEYATDTFDFARTLVPRVRMYRDSSFVDSTGAVHDTTILAGTLRANLYSNPEQHFMGSLFRGWGHFAFKGDKGNGTINEGQMNLDQLTSYPSDPNAYDTSNMTTVDDPSKADFAMLYADLNKQSWIGYDSSVYITGGTMSSSRLYMHDVSVDSMSAGSGAIGKVSFTETHSSAAGATGFPAGGGVSGGTSWATTTINTDMMDMNGDRYPDILSDENIQYTLPHGGLGTTVIQQPVGATESSGFSWGVGLGGDFQEANTGNKTGKSSVGALKTAKSSMGLSGSVNNNDDETGSTFLDMNGDGLTDRVYNNGTVSLNLGYRFAAAEHWGSTGIDASSSLSWGAGLGVNIESGSFEGGIGLARTEGRNKYLLSDVNGDGLPDQLELSGNDVHVRFNTGTGFGEVVSWTGDDLAKIFSVGESINTAFTVTIPIYIIFMKICINPVFNFGNGFSRQEKAFMDIDGDGFADYVQSDNDGQMMASASAIGRTNMLKAVRGPLGASLSLDYERVGNTYEMPQSKWVLKSTSLFDGVTGDGVDTMRQHFTYEGGYYDRREREFYGFRKVTTSELNTATNNSLYRKNIEEYYNSSYYNKGLLASEWTEDSAGHKYTQTVNIYDIGQVGTMTDVRFPALVQTKTLRYEGGNTAGDSTTIAYKYDALGNIIQVIDAGDGLQSDMLTTNITYHNVNNPYIKSVPSSVEMITAEGVKRKRTTSINSDGDITKINQFLADGTIAVTDLEYDVYGNVTKQTRPANYRDQRMSYTYEYDNIVHSYPTKVTDAFGYISTSEYDYRFGTLTRTISRNNEETRYEVDNHGRITTFTGPYEIAANKPYTIRIDYHTEAAVPYAVTSHYDPEFDDDIDVINFADGLGRSIQLKKQVSLFKGKDMDDELKMVVSGRVFYDAFGRPSKTLYPVTEAKGPANTTYNRAHGGLASTTAYDVDDRLVKSILADGATTTTTFSIADGLTSRVVTDPLNNRKETLTDIRDRKRFVKLFGPDGTITTRYDYNALDELVKVVDSKGNNYTTTYDNLGRTTRVDHPDAGRTDFEYDLAGNMIKKINAQIRKDISGGAIQYQYDYERLTDIDYPHHYQNKVKYIYGEAGSGVKAGRITLQLDGSGGQEFFYSMQGQVVKTIRTVLTSPQFATTYISETEYDSWNRVKKMVYPDGEEIMYHYNRGGALQSMDGAKRGSYYQFVNQVGYNEYDQRIYMRYSNGTENHYSYDSLRRRLTKVRALGTTGQAMMNNTYTYDAVGNVLGFVNDVQPQSGSLGGYAKQDFHYDNLYRLDSASGEYRGAETTGFGLRVTYDNLNNMTHKTVSGKGAYDLAYLYEGTAPHQASQIGANKYTYDENGNQLGYGDIENFYDEENRLVGVINEGVLSQFSYDASDNRVIKSSGGMQSLWINGAPAGAVQHNDNYTVYVSPYVTCKKAEFAKHYYIEDVRVATKLGHGNFTNITFPQTGLTAGGVDYMHRVAMIEQHRNEYYASLGVSPGPPTDKNFWAKPENSGIPAPVFTDTTASNVPNGWPGNVVYPPNGPPIFMDTIPSRDSVHAGYGFAEAGHIYEGNIFFYHFDNMGSTNYVTNFEGKVSKHYEYSPLGELFISEHTGSFETPYQFNGKGLDFETGFYFYGGQFYDPAIGQWLSIPDPLGESLWDDGAEGYVRVAGNSDAEENEDIDLIENINIAVSRVAYSGSTETQKAWADKKLNTKTKDKISKIKLRSLSKDPRVNVLANMLGDNLERLQSVKSKDLRSSKTATRWNATKDFKNRISPGAVNYTKARVNMGKASPAISSVNRILRMQSQRRKDNSTPTTRIHIMRQTRQRSNGVTRIHNLSILKRTSGKR